MKWTGICGSVPSSTALTTGWGAVVAVGAERMEGITTWSCSATKLKWGSGDLLTIYTLPHTLTHILILSLSHPHMHTYSHMHTCTVSHTHTHTHMLWLRTTYILKMFCSKIWKCQCYWAWTAVNTSDGWSYNDLSIISLFKPIKILYFSLWRCRMLVCTRVFQA